MTSEKHLDGGTGLELQKLWFGSVVFFLFGIWINHHRNSCLEVILKRAIVKIMENVLGNIPEIILFNEVVKL